MIPHLRSSFNKSFTSEKYATLRRRLDELGGTRIDFRISETPCFFSKFLLDDVARCGSELIKQLVENPAYLAASDKAVPKEFNVPRQSSRPLFVAADFGLVKNAESKLEPKLVEIQGFPSLYAYQVLLAEQYKEIFGLEKGIDFFLSGLSKESYEHSVRRAIVGDQDPENVVLMEIDPFEQKTLVDFLLTKKMCGIEIVNISDIVKEGRSLTYRKNGKSIPIKRIYNRAIVDELVRKGKELPFRFTDDLDVEWAGHPNWFFRISKFSIPFLKHASIPQTWFLNELKELPKNLDQYVLKPLYSFAGMGVIVGPTKGDLELIPAERRSEYILQERMNFEPVIETPHGKTKTEIRILYIWLEELLPVISIIRMGRGKMMGVDHNKNMEWVGSSAAFFPTP